MRKLVVYLLVASFVLQSISQLCVLVSFYVQRDYIADNLCINRFDTIPVCKGQCYLDDQLKENEKREQQLPDLKQKEVQLFFQQTPAIAFQIVLPTDKKSPVHRQQHSSSCGFPDGIYHPPKYRMVFS